MTFRRLNIGTDHFGADIKALIHLGAGTFMRREGKCDNNRFAYHHNHKNIFVSLRWNNTAYAPYVFVCMITYTLKFICKNCMLKKRMREYQLFSMAMCLLIGTSQSIDNFQNLASVKYG